MIASVGDGGTALDRLTADQRAAFEDALIGLYKRRRRACGAASKWRRSSARRRTRFDAVPEGLLIPLPDGERILRLRGRPGLRTPDCELPTGEVVLSGPPLPWADWVDPLGGRRGREVPRGRSFRRVDVPAGRRVRRSATPSMISPPIATPIESSPTSSTRPVRPTNC